MKLGDVCKKGSSAIAQKDLEGRDGEYPIFGASGFIKNVDFYSQDKPYIAVVKDGAGVGRVMKLPARSSVIGTMQYIIPNRNINIDYLMYAMQYMDLGKYYTGATIPHIYFKDYCNETLPDHSGVEQCRIAVILNKTNELIAIRQQQLAKLDELVKSRFVEMFGDPLSGNPNFIVSTFGNHFNISSGGTPSTDNPVFWDNGSISWIGSNMCQNDIIYKNDGKFITKYALEHSSTKMLSAGTVLVALVGATIGKSALLRFSTTTNQNIAAIDVVNNKNFTSEYIFYLIQFLYIKFQELGRGGFKMANQKFIKELPLLCVPVDIQKQFSAFVKQTEKTKSSIKQSLERLETLKKSLMQEFFG